MRTYGSVCVCVCFSFYSLYAARNKINGFFYMHWTFNVIFSSFRFFFFIFLFFGRSLTTFICIFGLFFVFLVLYFLCLSLITYVYFFIYVRSNACGSFSFHLIFTFFYFSFILLIPYHGNLCYTFLSSVSGLLFLFLGKSKKKK